MAEIGFNAELSVNDGEADAQADFGGLVTIKLPDLDVTDHEYAEHGQGDYYYRNLPGLIKSSRLTVEAHYSAALWARAHGLLREEKTWQIRQPDPDIEDYTPQQFQFSGYLSKLPGSTFERDGITMFAFEVTPNGDWTITGGTITPP